ncbi:MAG: PASTA domain-containing protein [Acutalibacteraceae bacterium]|nr:PASTA domain-containing protein [Acutalibacteraceae bacterium]
MAQLCLGCMQKNNGEKVCPICGFNRDTVQNAPFMPLGTELQDGNYIVGKKLSGNAESAKYIGFSKTMGTKVIISEFMPAGICGRANGKKKVVIRGGYEEQFQKLNEEFLSYYRSVARLRELSAIAPIFDIFSENGVSYTVAEYYDSIPFTEYINRRNGSIDWNTARPLFMPLITALSGLHAAGIGHYAISPDNLVVTSSGKLRLTDFALKELRQTGGFFEPELMDGCAAPEQYKEIGVLDEATDVYGFTATLFYALTGRLPENSSERKPDGKLSIPTAVFKRLPPHIISALADGLQVQKLSRIATFEDLRTQLSSAPTVKAIQNEANRNAIQSEVAANYTPRKKDGVPGFVWGLLTVLASLLILLGAGIYWITNNPDSFNSFITGKSDNTEEESNLDNGDPDMIVIPNLVDQRYSDLIAKLGASNDFVLIKTEDEISDKYEEGVIKSQSPEPGITARKGVTIVVTVSMGSADRELPVIAGQSIETAVRALNAQGFVASGVYMSSETVEAGKVIGYQSHSAGDKERYGSTVVIQISTGPEP